MPDQSFIKSPNAMRSRMAGGNSSTLNGPEVQTGARPDAPKIKAPGSADGTVMLDAMKRRMGKS